MQALVARGSGVASPNGVQGVAVAALLGLVAVGPVGSQLDARRPPQQRDGDAPSAGPRDERLRVDVLRAVSPLRISTWNSQALLGSMFSRTGRVTRKRRVCLRPAGPDAGAQHRLAAFGEPPGCSFAWREWSGTDFWRDVGVGVSASSSRGGASSGGDYSVLMQIASPELRGNMEGIGRSARSWSGYAGFAPTYSSPAYHTRLTLHFPRYGVADKNLGILWTMHVTDSSGQQVIYSHKDRVDTAPPLVKRRGAALASVSDALGLVLQVAEQLDTCHRGKSTRSSSPAMRIRVRCASSPRPLGRATATRSDGFWLADFLEAIPEDLRRVARGSAGLRHGSEPPLPHDGFRAVAESMRTAKRVRTASWNTASLFGADGLDLAGQRRLQTDASRRHPGSPGGARHIGRYGPVCTPTTGTTSLLLMLLACAGGRSRVLGFG